MAASGTVGTIALSVMASSLVCLAAAQTPAPASAPAANSAEKPTLKADVVAVDVDTAVSPGDDFFTYANGAWLKAHPIPKSEAWWGIGKAVDEELYKRLCQISETSAAKVGATAGSDEQKIGDFWRTAMDEAHAEAQGI